MTADLAVGVPMKRKVALLLIAGAAWCGAAAAAQAPAAVAEIERDVYDDPVSVLRDARTRLATRTAGAHAERLRLLVRQALAANLLERTDEVAAVLPEAEALARQLEARDMQCLLRAAGLSVEHETKGWAAMAESATQTVQEASASDEAWCAPRLLEQLAAIHGNDGRRAAALEAGQAAEAAFQAAGERLMLAVARSHLSWVLSERDDDTEAVQRSIAFSEQALAGIDRQRHRRLVVEVLHTLVGARIAAKDWHGARRDAAEAERQLHRLEGDLLGLAYIRRQQGEIELRDGQPALALEYLRAARRTFAEAQVDAMIVTTSALEAEALVTLHRPAQALRVLADAEPPRAGLGLPKWDVPYFRTALEAHAAIRDSAATAAAARAYADALQRRQHEENHRLATELQERYASAQKEAENRLLRGEQEVQHMRMLALVAMLGLAGLVLAALGVYLVQQRRLRTRLKRLAEVDELTGLPNRRAILEALNDGAARKRGGRAIAMLDIDHFKRVNDRWGHAAGDAALVSFAQACSGVLRDGDVMGRLGGEEFLLVLRRSRAAELQPLFDRMRSALQASPVDGLPAEERLSFSMGAVDLPAQGDTEAALRAADEALYRAKAAGRDRMEIAAAIS